MTRSEKDFPLSRLKCYRQATEAMDELRGARRKTEKMVEQEQDRGWAVGERETKKDRRTHRQTDREKEGGGGGGERERGE